MLGAPCRPPPLRSEGCAGARACRRRTWSAERNHGRQRNGVLLEGDGRLVPRSRRTTRLHPTGNGYIESFNGKLRDECLNAELFLDLLDARRKLDAWRRDYNENRPHSSI